MEAGMGRDKGAYGRSACAHKRFKKTVRRGGEAC